MYVVTALRRVAIHFPPSGRRCNALCTTQKPDNIALQEHHQQKELVLLEQKPYEGPPETPFEPFRIMFGTAAGEGISIGQALQDNVRELIGKGEPAFPPRIGVKAKASIRIQV